MSDFSARKPLNLSVKPDAAPDAKSKKLEETLEKLSAVKAQRTPLAPMPSFSAKPATQDNKINIAPIIAAKPLIATKPSSYENDKDEQNARIEAKKRELQTAQISAKAVIDTAQAAKAEGKDIETKILNKITVTAPAIKIEKADKKIETQEKSKDKIEDKPVHNSEDNAFKATANNVKEIETEKLVQPPQIEVKKQDKPQEFSKESKVSNVTKPEESEISITHGSTLKKLRITSAPESAMPTKRDEVSDFSARQAIFDGDAIEEEPVLALAPKNAVSLKRSFKYKATSFIGSALTAAWMFMSGYYIQGSMGFETLFAQQPHILGGFLAGILAPVALLWMLIAYMQRGSDIHMYADALRRELQSMIFPSEERAQVIHKDIESLCKQAAELSTSSNAVLNSIHRARVGLRNEIRDFSGLSKKTEFHIDRLADSLAVRSKRLLDLTDEIEKRTTSLDAKTISGAKAWDDAATSILSRAEEIETAMQKGAKQIVLAADEADKTTSNINSKLEASFDVLKASVDSVKSMTGTTVKAILDASKTIEDNRDTLGDGAKLLASKAAEITDSLNGSVSSIQDSIEQMVGKSNGIETRLSERVDALQNVLKDMDGKIISIENTGVEAANKLSEAMVSAISGADTVGSAVRRAVESLNTATNDATKQADEFVGRTVNKVATLHKTGEKTAQNIESALGLIDKSREGMEEASAGIDMQVQKLSAAVKSQSEEIAKAQDTLNDRVEAIQLTMTKPLEAMTRAVDKASEKHEQIEQTLSKRIGELNNASDKAVDNAKIIREGLRTQTQEMSTLVGQIAGHSRSANALMAEQAEVLSNDIAKTLSRFDNVGDKLKGQSDTLQAITKTAEDSISSLNESLAKNAMGVQTSTGKVVDELSGLDSIIEQKLRLLIEGAVAANKNVEEYTSNLVKTADIIEPIYNRATSQISSTKEQFDNMAASYEEGTTSNLDKLKAMGVVFDERLKTLTSSAQDASRILDQSSENLSERVEDIDNASTSAAQRLKEVEHLLKTQASNIHLTTDEALLKIETIQKTLDEQFQDLSSAVSESVAQVENVGQKFVKQASQITAVSNQAVDSFDAAGTKADEQTQSLKHLATVTAEQMEEIARRIKNEAQQLLESSSKNLIEMKKTGDSFANRAKQIEEQMRLSVVNTKDYGSALDKQAEKIAETSDKTSDRISKAVSLLAARLLDVDKTANTVTSNIESSRDKLASDTELFAEVSIKAARVVDEAADAYVRQSNSLFKATENAVSVAEAIRKTEGRVQRESFLNSTRFILESLHSLSVDLTRMIEGEVQEKIWKAYQKGDVSAFTSRLLEIKDKLPMEKMKAKYSDDNEFRTYVNRFIRQFEDVYEQAAESDHGELLAATFASSDIGRLYGILCDVAGRTNLIKKLGTRVA